MHKDRRTLSQSDTPYESMRYSAPRVATFRKKAEADLSFLRNVAAFVADCVEYCALKKDCVRSP